METTTIYEGHARHVKATKLADVLWSSIKAIQEDHGDDDPVSEIVAGLTDDLWKSAARLAGVNPPSDKTKRLVIKFLQRRESATADPLVGLPGNPA